MSDEIPAPMPTEPTGRQLAKLEADNRGVLAILPRTIDEAQRIASGLISSGIVPDSFREGGRSSGAVNAPLVLMGVLKSMEIGLPPITGISWLMPINNRFAIYGDGAIALVQSKGLVANQKPMRIGKSFDPTTPLGDWPEDYGWLYKVWRKGQPDPYEWEFTVGAAKRAGLWMNGNKKPWLQYPDRMLFNRARAIPLRDGFADALMGLSIAEEMIDTLPDPVDGGTLKPAGKPDFLSDEPVTKAIQHEQDVGERLGEQFGRNAELTPRDTGNADDLNRDF